MKKKFIILFTFISLISGILTGLLVSGFVWTDEGIPDTTDSYSEQENLDEGDEVGISVGDSRKTSEKEIDYGITNGQRYYKKLVGDEDVNVLLIGEDAASGNFDTIIIASVSDSDKKIRLFNLPRDIYVDYSDEILSRIKEKSPKLYEAKGFQKINAAHTVGKRIEYKKDEGKYGDSDIDFLADLLEELFQITIDDYAYVNTKGFREIVDLFDGVYINVPVRMKYEDPMQNLYIDIKPGMQHLDGKQAEGFVRFRQGYDDNGVYKNYSDQFRKENQNEFLKAFFKQHITIKNLGKIDDLLKLMNKNVRTSINSVKRISFYVNMMRKALNGKYDQEAAVVECTEAKKIDGVYFDIIRSE